MYWLITLGIYAMLLGFALVAYDGLAVQSWKVIAGLSLLFGTMVVGHTFAVIRHWPRRNH